jgi:hypothetical protein
MLTEHHYFKLKGVGVPSYHLDGDFSVTLMGTTLAWGAHSYVKKMLSNYEYMFGEKPRVYSSPMWEKDHPESDNSEEVDVLISVVDRCIALVGNFGTV